MEFVFEGKKRSGTGVTVNEPDYPAVMITQYKSETTGRLRYRFAFSSKAIELSRWIKGDQVEVGADKQTQVLAIRRAPGTGYRLGGQGFSEGDKGKRERPSFQISTSPDSTVSILAQKCLQKWTRLYESGVLVITASLAEKNKE